MQNNNIDSRKSAKASEKLTDRQRKVVHQAVKKVVDEYGETLRRLGNE